MKRLVRGIVVSSMAALLVGALASPALASGTGATPSRVSLGGPGHYLHRGSHGEADVNVCSTAVGPGVAHCDVHVRTDLFGKDVTPLRRGPNPAGSPVKNSTLGNAGAYDAAFLQSAYNAPSLTNGSGQTVAIVDAYDAPHIEADLATYRAQFLLPACTTANGCFKKVDQNGGTHYPVGNTGWAEEASLDVQMVSALCPRCNILLVEANTATISDLGAAVNEAVALGANVVSNSYGAGEWSAGDGRRRDVLRSPGCRNRRQFRRLRLRRELSRGQSGRRRGRRNEPASGDLLGYPRTRPSPRGREPAAAAARTSPSPRGRPTHSAGAARLPTCRRSRIRTRVSGCSTLTRAVGSSWVERASRRRSSAPCTRSPVTRLRPPRWDRGRTPRPARSTM